MMKPPRPDDPRPDRTGDEHVTSVDPVESPGASSGAEEEKEAAAEDRDRDDPTPQGVAARPPLPPAPPEPGGDRTPAPASPPPGSAAPPRVEKSPPLAAFLSILPGLGHLYTESYRRAVMVVTTFFLGVYLLPLPFAVFIPMFIWFFGLFDAYRQAQLANATGPERERHESTRGDGALAFGVFLVVVGGVVLIDNFYPIDMRWLRDWWPALLVAAGLYFIGAAVRERIESRGADG